CAAGAVAADARNAEPVGTGAVGGDRQRSREVGAAVRGGKDARRSANPGAAVRPGPTDTLRLYDDVGGEVRLPVRDGNARRAADAGAARSAVIHYAPAPADRRQGHPAVESDAAAGSAWRPAVA